MERRIQQISYILTEMEVNGEQQIEVLLFTYPKCPLVNDGKYDYPHTTPDH